MKTLEIKIPEGHEIDQEASTFERVVFKKIENKLPKQWEALGVIEGYYVRTGGSIQIHEISVYNSLSKVLWPTRREAEAALALSQLCQLRDKYNSQADPKWDNSIPKYVIYPSNYNSFILGTSTWYPRVLWFKSPDLRDEFFSNFKDLIETAKLLL